MKPIHNPLASAETCSACQAGDTSFNHAAVTARRPRNFEALYREALEEIASGRDKFCGITLHPAAADRARRLLKGEKL